MPGVRVGDDDWLPVCPSPPAASESETSAAVTVAGSIMPLASASWTFNFHDNASEVGQHIGQAHAVTRSHVVKARRRVT